MHTIQYTILQNIFFVIAASLQQTRRILMQSEKQESRKLDFELIVSEGKLFIEYRDQHTNIFLQKRWFETVRELFDQSQVQNVSFNSIMFKQNFLMKDIKNFKHILHHKLEAIRYCQSGQIYMKRLKENLQRVLNINISVPGKQKGSVQKIPYKQFIICYDILQLEESDNMQGEISFENRNSKGFIKPHRQVVIPRSRNRHFQKQDEIALKLPKVQLLIFYMKEDHSKIIQLISNLEQFRQQWLLYSMNPYLDQFSLDKIYYEELIQKILIKKSKDLHLIVQRFNFQPLDKNIKLLKDDTINHNRNSPAHPELQEGYYLGFHVFGQTKHYYQFYLQLNQLLQSWRMWILRPQKICCCQSLIDIEEFLKVKQGLEAFLISDHIIVVIKFKQDMDNLRSIQNKQKLKKQGVSSEEDRLLRIIQTGIFVLDLNDYDQEDLLYVYKERQGYKKFLEKQYGVIISFTPETTRLRICVQCQISAFRIFKGCIYSYINDMRRQKQELPQFSSTFHRFIFENYLRKDLQKQFPQIKFCTRKRKNIEQLWVRFYAKDRSCLMEKLQQLRKNVEANLDYIVCKKQPIAQNWFILYRRPQILSIQTLTCRKYLISKDTKIYVQPYQSLSRQVDEMLFLIDQSFQNCWQFTEIAEQNDINLMSLFLEFQQKKKKKPDRIKSIHLINHRYINRMVLWYNDMLKKIQNRRDQDIKKLYKRYENNKELHIMIPRHASTNILLNFVLPSFIKEFTQQTGYNLKQIYFYYPILFDDKHCFVEDLTLKIIDEQMRRESIELQNQNYLTKGSIKKIIQMEYITLHCMFQGDQRVWKASNLSSYVFYIEREILRLKKYQGNGLMKANDKSNVPNFKVPLFFMDASFNIQILVDLGEELFYKVGRNSVQGPNEIKSQKRYQEIGRCISCIRNIFRSLSYVVLYIDADYKVGKNGYYYSHKLYLTETDTQRNKLNGFHQLSFMKNKVKFQTNGSRMTQSQKVKNGSRMTQAQRPKKQSLLKFNIYPMRLQINTSSTRRNNYEQCGKIIKRGSRRLTISIVQSEIENWFMLETYKDKLSELAQYLKSASNYKNNENFLLQQISQYSIFDLKEQAQNSRLLDFGNEQQEKSEGINGSLSMVSLDLSLISHVESSKTGKTDHLSVLSQLHTSSQNML